ncbi:MAG: dipeptidase, partial [Clostridia bacterium]|nr:dipeptidase [Clostridia bacterium]
MQKIAYADLHCDSVTVCCDGGENMSDFDGQTNVRKLIEAGCAAQCFALFTEGKNASADFKRYAEFYNVQIKSDPRVQPVLCYNDLLSARRGGKLAAILTVENMGFLNGGVSGIKELKKLGVRMASLVWNTPNEFAFPNLIFRDGAPDFAARETRGLTRLGK